MPANFASRWCTSVPVWLSLAAICLLAPCGGCMCNKGVELRGDWGLQLNHVPWDEQAGVCHDCGPGGCTAQVPGGAPHDGAAPALATPVHRFHTVPTAPVVTATPAIGTEPAPSPAIAEIEAGPQPVYDGRDDAPAPPPSTREAVSVLKPYTKSDEPAWVFRTQPTRPAERVASDRRRLSSGWQPAPPRR